MKLATISRTACLCIAIASLGCAASGAGPVAGPSPPASGPSPPAPAPAPAATQPFRGAPHAIPGTIEAEDFDDGPGGVAWHDVDPENQGAPYRKTGVDVEARPDASGGHGVGWTKAGEWLVYTVDVATAGSYKLEIPVASPAPGGTFHIELGGADVTGLIQAPNTGSWQKLQVISRSGVKLEAGRQPMRVVMDSEGETKSVADIDFFRFTREP
ncbi:MAG: carbohydrate-binding protein [Planctomycetes bacterium]|nr:carbohydrate-binding protein [Planctomycetota bacterium]